MTNTRKNQKGIALIVAILLSFLALTLIGGLLWLIVSSTQISGMYKQYASAKDACVGGAEVIIDSLYWGQPPSLPPGTYSVKNPDCFYHIKREKPTQYWGSCTNVYPDLIINFGKINSSSDFYTVNATITSTNIALAGPLQSGGKTYAISIDASNTTKLDKAGIDFVYTIGQ